jgi:hypothetical protein
MARAYNVHVVQNRQGTVIKAFTVKHNLLWWLRDQPLSQLTVTTIRDGMTDEGSPRTVEAQEFIDQ